MKKIHRKLVSGLASIHHLISTIFSLLYIGNSRFCPLCQKKFSKFLSYGSPLRSDARCPRCGSLERHRFLWLFLEERTDFFGSQGRRMLHIAPEKCFEPRFKKVFRDGYLTADLNNSRAMEKMDITNIPYPDETFDIIYCSHVLEHIPDDKKALRELNRVLKNNGWAIILVPIEGKTTYEDPSIVTPEARLAAFGQIDHVRIYGEDYFERLEKTGFKTEVITLEQIADKVKAENMGLSLAAGEIFYSKKNIKNVVLS